MFFSNEGIHEVLWYTLINSKRENYFSTSNSSSLSARGYNMNSQPNQYNVRQRHELVRLFSQVNSHCKDYAQTRFGHPEKSEQHDKQ